MPVQKDPTTARQGERGKPMLRVLVASLFLAVVLAVGGYLYVSLSDDDALDEPIPAAETVGESEG